MTDDQMRAVAEFALANDELRATLERVIDTLAELLKRIPYEDLLHEDERDHHQRMIYAVYFAPARSSN